MSSEQGSPSTPQGATSPVGFRIGHGWDRHRLEPPPPAGKGRALVIGGVGFCDGPGPVARSDGDALLHAVTDAVLGALGEGDIGVLFPDEDERNEGRDSSEFAAAAVELARRTGWRVGNLDATVVLERPKLADRRALIRENLARLLGVDESAVNVKGKTGEGVDAVGEGRAIEAHAVVLLIRDS